MTKMKPILFSTEMVRAILEGRKTMTRRVATPLKRGLDVGDILYIREEHYRYGTWNEVPGVKTKGGRQKWEFVPLTDEVRYFDNPPEEFKKGRHHKLAQFPGWYKRLARFMPKAHARNFIQVTGVRLDMLGEITPEDAISEGIESFRPVPGDGPAITLYKDYTGGQWTTSSLHSFRSLWRSIHGGWDGLEWVWVYSFKRIEKPE